MGGKKRGKGYGVLQATNNCRHPPTHLGCRAVGFLLSAKSSQYLHRSTTFQMTSFLVTVPLHICWLQTILLYLGSICTSRLIQLTISLTCCRTGASSISQVCWHCNRTSGLLAVRQFFSCSPAAMRATCDLETSASTVASAVIKTG